MGVIMSEQNKRSYGIKVWSPKTARAAIIQKIAADFNLMPIIAEAYYKPDQRLFRPTCQYPTDFWTDLLRAVAADEPAGKHIALARKVSCRLTLNDIGSDFEALATMV